MQEKTLIMNRVFCAVLTVMMLLALVPTYAFASNNTNLEYKVAENSSDSMTLVGNSIHYSKHKGGSPDAEYLHSIINDDWSTEQFLWDYYDGIGNEAAITETDDDIIIDLAKFNLGSGDTISFMSEIMLDSHPYPSKTITIHVSEKDSSDNTGSDNSNITIETEASTINVTVPTNAAFIFKSDGTSVYPSNYEITNNNALTAIALNSIDFEGVNGWSLTTEDDVFQADQKKFALKMGLKDGTLSVVDKANGVSFSGDTEIRIAPNGSKTLGFEAKRGVFSSPVTTENAMQMTMHFDWEHAA